MSEVGGVWAGLLVGKDGCGIGVREVPQDFAALFFNTQLPHTWDCCAGQVCAEPTLGLSMVWKCTGDLSVLKAAQGSAQV